MTLNNNYALVTGASQGLGREIARELASLGYNLLLTALPDERLPELVRDLENKYQIRVSHKEADLAQADAVHQVAAWANNYPLKVLINNAGIGGTMPYQKANPEYINKIIQVNITAPALLIRLLLPSLEKHDQAYILNVSSMAAFSPMAFKTVYPASKAFVWSFSRGLHEELKSSGVFVGVIHPGPIKTNPEVCKRIEQQKLFGRLGQVSPEKLAHIAIKQLFQHDSLLIPGIMNKLNWILIKIIPIWIRMGFLSKVVQREISETKQYSFS
ncbi:MAG: SDR family NAD(P)-dependent oxidoreductase [Bacteroidetes bacterium]|jgi:uncharacterized protein|nr:SDR family NAD(P)-dependent oxidoreductase [Bacteroidota bacterium]MBT4401021.1 SDR family NAD(P)-dependent oxidoreductase [Bacteroidota bacterium]MBT4412118.1 SDR family NAD(P)-dependent oxidoreductase [Bacteroidota bacterium]MBT5427304.1 SDR family NAD(P)-dependent oxidoreductase [Bacteroidota bacterium]MBT7092663.1 SDR family NAD(P)-dependent oxidoreductase [Bacteroidota bacterium]